MGVTIIDENGHSLISLTGPDGIIKAEPRWMQERSGLVIRRVFANWYSKSLPPSSLSIVYSVPVDLVPSVFVFLS
ncbi:hypothetical protein MYA98_06180 [Salmonella sp. WGH-01]|nr:hypothetical protein MYA98_06180 [Salmonella sp. WGH-01]